MIVVGMQIRRNKPVDCGIVDNLYQTMGLTVPYWQTWRAWNFTTTYT